MPQIDSGSVCDKARQSHDEGSENEQEEGVGALVEDGAPSFLEGREVCGEIAAPFVEPAAFLAGSKNGALEPRDLCGLRLKRLSD